MRFVDEHSDRFARPQTLAYGLHDSPAGQLAWIVEKLHDWTNSAKTLPEDAVDRDHILTNVSLYWFTGTAGSSANLYYETAHQQQWPEPSGVPTGVAVFAEDVAIRRYSEPLNRPETLCEALTVGEKR